MIVVLKYPRRILTGDAPQLSMGGSPRIRKMPCGLRRYITVTRSEAERQVVDVKLHATAYEFIVNTIPPMKKQP